MRNLILIIIVMFSASCMTEKRATKKIARLGIQYPYSGATFCANAYPARVEYKQTIEYKEGKHDTIWQAEYIDCDTIIGTDRIVKVPYPVVVPRRDTLIYRDSIFTENRAKLESTEREKNRAEAEAKVWKKKARRNAVYGFLTGFITYFVAITLIKR